MNKKAGLGGRRNMCLIDGFLISRWEIRTCKFFDILLHNSASMYDLFDAAALDYKMQQMVKQVGEYCN